MNYSPKRVPISYYIIHNQLIHLDGKSAYSIRSYLISLLLDIKLYGKIVLC
jgi:hypothetical protein